MEYTKIKTNYIKLIGKYGPEILFYSTILLLLLTNQIYLFFIYLIAYSLNRLLNIIIRSNIIDNTPLNGDHGIHNMPSGHSQTIIFSFIFMMYFLKLNKNIIALFYLSIIANTLHNCIIYNYHTPAQIVAGLLLGTLFAFFTIYLISQKKYLN